MALFVIVSNSFTTNTFFVVLQIIISMIIYFGIMFLIKGITKEDLKLLKFIPYPGRQIPMKKADPLKHLDLSSSQE